MWIEKIGMMYMIVTTYSKNGYHKAASPVEPISMC